MNSQLAESAERLFETHVSSESIESSAHGGFPHSLWTAVEEAGFAAAMLPESAGGFGVTLSEAMTLLQISAAHAAPIPLAETMLARWILASAGLVAPDGPLTLAPVRSVDTPTLQREKGGWRLKGSLGHLPWARHAAAIAVVAENEAGPLVALLPADSFSAVHSYNLAGEARDSIAVNLLLQSQSVAPAPAAFGPLQLRGSGAMLRTVQIAGALTRALALSVDYAQTRVQFGRPIGKFQAIQQSLAILGGQSAAASAAADLAVDAFERGIDLTRVAAAKARAGEAASVAAGLSHQIHGAIGFTQEYELHRLTQRMWSWRDEFGSEAEWNGVVGRAAFAAGPDGIWPMLTASNF